MDVAVRWQFPRGGWCPKGSALESAFSSVFTLAETPSSDPGQALEWNVRDSDATVLFTISSVPLPENEQGPKRMFIHLTRGDLRLESGVEVSRGPGSE